MVLFLNMLCEFRFNIVKKHLTACSELRGRKPFCRLRKRWRMYVRPLPAVPKKERYAVRFR